MTKSELIEVLAKREFQLAYKDVELAVKTMLEYMSSTLSTGERIEIRGFGSFSLFILIFFKKVIYFFQTLIEFNSMSFSCD